MAAFSFENNPNNAEELQQIRETLEVIERQAQRLGLVVPKPRQPEMWDIVGDPHCRYSVQLFERRVDHAAETFRQARKRAWTSLRDSGQWSLVRLFVTEWARGFYAIACLRIAGLLYRLRIEAVIDTRKHKLTLDGIFSEYRLASV